MKIIRFALAIILVATSAVAQDSGRALRVDDIFNIRDVRDPQRSPDGQWVAYTVTTAIKDTDKNNTDVWMVSWDGTQHIQVTSTPEGESSPRWSPDNKYLSFISSRQGAKRGQVWLLNRAGGEAVKITDIKAGVSDHVWAPDGKRLALVVRDPDPADKDDDEKDEKKTPKPIVLDRYRFKADVRGFLRGERSHIYIFDIATKKAEILTPGSFDEGDPIWSPDGRQIAFTRNHGEGDVDRMPNQDVFVIEARPGAQPRRLTTTTAQETGRLAWSPDGRSIAYLLGDEVKYSAYQQRKLAIVPAAGGEPRIVTESLDRPVHSISWSPDGSSLFFVMVDDRAQHLARVPASGGRVEKLDKLTEGRRVITDPSIGADGHFAVLASTATEIPEVHALEARKLRKLTRQNEDWLKGVQLGTTEDFTSTSKDGTVVNSIVVKPAAFDASKKYPLLLRIHGGPNGQDQHSFNYEREIFAANGYIVLAVNYRGSNGRGNAYQKEIFADWGNKEVVDLLGAMDAIQKMPWVDSSRLGIGGWSYGGILTNYTIATDMRFKAAVSGAGSSNQLSMYGSDQYVTQYDQEMGPPWKNQEGWIRISYPFFHADRIKTPTLFVVGQDDFNVPLAGSEQMYQALRSLGVDTQLVIYPKQFHGITIPSYRIDRMQRYLDWYAKYLKPAVSTTASRN